MVEAGAIYCLKDTIIGMLSDTAGWADGKA